MKKVFYLLLLGLFVFTKVHAFTMQQAIEADRRCMVEYVYNTVGYASNQVSVLETAANECISFTSGSGLWFAQKKRKENPAFDETNEQSLKHLEMLKKQAIMVLRRRLPECQLAISAEFCLEKIKTR
jgi:hypothetical protein